MLKRPHSASTSAIKLERLIDGGEAWLALAAAQLEERSSPSHHGRCNRVKSSLMASERVMPL